MIDPLNDDGSVKRAFKIPQRGRRAPWEQSARELLKSLQRERSAVEAEAESLVEAGLEHWSEANYAFLRKLDEVIQELAPRRDAEFDDLPEELQGELVQLFVPDKQLP